MNYHEGLTLTVTEAKHLKSELLVSVLELPDVSHDGEEGALVIRYPHHPGRRVKLPGAGGHHISIILKQ